jgi:drug/metabolite transporter (DMT)-like permease
MFLLILVSFVWAFSPGLIKGRLAGLDPVAISVVRLGLAALVFAPFFRLRQLPLTVALRFALIGAVQFGLMYVLYLRAFAYLHAYEIALFTIFTPFYVALCHGALERRFFPRHLVAATVAVVGAAVIVWSGGLRAGVLTGFLLMQGSNISFAIGQVAYKRLRPRAGAVSDPALFAWLYVGAITVTGLLSIGATDWSAFRPTNAQWLTLGYLGVLASGLSFFAWNLGALRVNAGTLAVFNNVKIPLMVACSLVFFGEQADLSRLLLSGTLMAASIWIAERS